MKIHVISPILAPNLRKGEKDKRAEARIKASASVNAEVVFRYIDEGPEFIEGVYDDAMAVPGTVKAVRECVQAGADAVVINCSADTGVEAAKEAVDIPVVGPSVCTMYLAAQLTHRFSVLTFSDRTISRFENIAHHIGIGFKLASVRSVEIPFMEIGKNEEELVQRLFEAVELCFKEDGAHGIILGCTDFEDVGDALVSYTASKHIPVTIFKPYEVALHQAHTQASLKLFHSKASYPKPKDVTSG